MRTPVSGSWFCPNIVPEMFTTGGLYTVLRPMLLVPGTTAISPDTTSLLKNESEMRASNRVVDVGTGKACE